jgi:hypothetical protein
MKKNTLIATIIAGSAFAGIMLWTKLHTPTGPIPLRVIKREERHRTVERTLTKKTDLESQAYVEEYAVKLECTFTEIHYEYAPYLEYVVAICQDKSDEYYTPLSRETVQTCVTQRAGFTQKIIPITGMTLEDEGAWCVLPGEGNIFYLNMPIDIVQFLNKIEATLRTDVLMRDAISQEDIVHYNLINALIHGGLRIISEMDQSKPHVCAYNLKSLDNVDIAYDVKEKSINNEEQLS